MFFIEVDSLRIVSQYSENSNQSANRIGNIAVVILPGIDIAIASCFIGIRDIVVVF